MRAMKICGLAMAGMLAATATAQAGYIADGTMDRIFRLHSTYGANWVDRVGTSNPFELYGVDVSSSSSDGGTLNLSIYTNYGLNPAGAYQTRTADIAFKLDGATNFNFGLILVDHDTDASAARRDNNGLEAGFYAVNSWMTSEDIFGDLGSVAYGGRAAICTDNASCNLQTPQVVYTYINSGTLIAVDDGQEHNGFTLTIASSDPRNDILDLTPHSDIAMRRIDITMTGVGELFGPAWEMMFGNATCGNDTIFVSGVGIPPELPEPAAMGLMLLGLVGLGAVRRATAKS